MGQVNRIILIVTGRLFQRDGPMQDSTWKENEDLPSLPSKATDNMNGHQQASNSCIYARTKLPAEE